MSTTVDTLLVRIEADMSDLKRNLDKVQRDVDKSSQGISGAFRRMGTAIKAAVAAVVVQQAGRAGAALVNLASDIEEMQGKSSVVFGRFADDVRSQLTDFGNIVGRSSHELEGMASSIQDTFVPMGFARGEAAKLSVELTKLAVDVASFNNASDTETMEAFQSALVGNHETVRRFGVVITEATLKQELLRMGITRTGDAVTNAEKVQARLNLITAGTTDAQGDAARTADSFANQMRALKAELSEVGAELGQILLPIAKDLVSTFRDLTGSVRMFLGQLGLIDLTPADRISILNRQLEKTEDLLDAARANAQENDFLVDIARQIGVSLPTQGDFNVDDLFNAVQQELNAKAEDLRLNIDVQRLLQQEPDAGGGAGAEGDGGGSEPFKASKTQTKIAGQNAVLKKRIEMQADINQLTKAGHTEVAKHVAKQLELFDANVKLTNVSDELGRSEVERLIALGHTDTLTQKLVSDNIALTGTQDGLTKSTEASAKALDEYQKLVEEGVKIGQAHIQDRLDLEQAQLALNAAMLEGAILPEQYKIAMADLKEQLAELDPMYEQIKESTLALSQSISNSFADALLNGKDALESLQGVFKNFVQQMIAKAIELFVVNKIMNAVFGLSGSSALPTKSFGLGQAGGGTLQAGRPTLVGERGPELIVPNSASTILNNQNTRGALSGGGGTVVNQTINVETGVSQTVRAEMISLLPKFKKDTMAAVLDAKRRGGTYGKAFA